MHFMHPLPRLCVHMRQRGVARAMRTYEPTCVYAPDAEYSPEPTERHAL